jgi:hypothetical protein
MLLLKTGRDRSAEDGVVVTAAQKVSTKVPRGD